jgi:PhzF family phenazine biosynthesis protein
VQVRLFQIDAFAERVFRGNPAAVVPLDAWPPDDLLQAVAAENNLSETAFLVRQGGDWAIRWFTPAVEVDLCGHATLASAWVVFHRLEPARRAVTFHSRSGPLLVERGEGGWISMRLPRHPGKPCDPPPALIRALGRAPRETLVTHNYLAVLDAEADVRALVPDLGEVQRLGDRGLIATAPADAARSGAAGAPDFVSRYFVPQAGIPEDPVTGSAHCTLVPYWAARLGKPALLAWQVSRRGGVLACQDRPDEGAVRVAGQAVPFLEGTATLG